MGESNYKKDLTHGKDIHWLAFIRRMARNLGRHVTDSAEFRHHCLFVLTAAQLALIEAGNLDAPIHVQDAVFQLQRAMRDIVLVDMLNARTNLAEQLSCLSVIEAFTRNDVIEEFSNCCQLGDDVVCKALFLPVRAELAASGPQNFHHMRMVHPLLAHQDFLVDNLLTCSISKSLP